MTKTIERVLAGRYRLEQVIGRGGMSTVYRATDQLLGRTVAVKVLLAALADQDSTYAERFAREARAAAALASSSVVTVYDTGIDEQGEQYIVMEYVDGHSLAELLADRHPLAVSEALRIGERVADALRAAHAAGILHRDIKPANVMLADDGSVKVLDFGIARRLDGTTLTQAAAIVGTAAYMAPERALGRPGDARADIYSLGCLLYAMLTGRAPFTGDAPAAVLHQQVNAEPPAPSGLRRGIPPALNALVLEMLAKAPEARPPTADQVRDRLRAVAGLPAVAASEATAATAPLGTVAPTLRHGATQTARVAAAATAGFRRTWLRDHRRRAVVMGLLTALVALAAVAILSAAGGGSSPGSASNRAPARRTSTTQARSTATHATTTHATTTKHATTNHAPTRTPTTSSPTSGGAPAAHSPPPAPGPAGGPAGHGGGPGGDGHRHGGPGGH